MSKGYRYRHPFKILLLVAIGTVFSCAPKAPPVGGVPPEIAARFQGVLEAEGVNVPLEGTEIRVGDSKAVADAQGRFALPDLQQGKNYLVAEKRFSQGAVRRTMGMSIVFVADNPFRIRVKMRDATDIDAFCRECHPYRGEKVRKDQVMRCVHISWVVPKKANGWREGRDEEGRVTCESCHTLHEKGSAPHFLVATVDKGVLCRRCHI